MSRIYFRGHKIVDEAAWVVIERNRERWRPLIHTVARTRKNAIRLYENGAPPEEWGFGWYSKQQRRGAAMAVRCAIDPTVGLLETAAEDSTLSKG